ncbi:MAG: hypothetical protein IPK18_05815 [Sphingobacteriales bacterium]|jgi:hypothetical protein|nr:MAG: hypothetical protein IPK18_05815 [Sphingobacteriales bacterium]
MCTHLKPIEDFLKSKGYVETYRGQVWSNNCREWIYFNTILQPKELITQFKLGSFITIHDYEDIKVGSELGLECTLCKDAIMGYHPSSAYSKEKYQVY